MRKLILILSLSAVVMISSGTSLLQAQQDSTWTLEKCINYALGRNIQVRKSELTTEQNVVNAEQAKAQRFPSVSASIGQNFNWSKNQ
jgi:outer membrane protein